MNASLRCGDDTAMTKEWGCVPIMRACHALRIIRTNRWLPNWDYPKTVMHSTTNQGRNGSTVGRVMFRPRHRYSCFADDASNGFQSKLRVCLVFQSGHYFTCRPDLSYYITAFFSEAKTFERVACCSCIPMYLR